MLGYRLASEERGSAEWREHIAKVAAKTGLSGKMVRPVCRLTRPSARATVAAQLLPPAPHSCALAQCALLVCGCSLAGQQWSIV